MKVAETISTAPIQVEKSIRGDEIRALTSCRAGKIVPLAYIPLLREDQVRRGTVRISLDMAETIHPLMNSINVTAMAHFVPFTAFERFRDLGMETFNRAYQGVAEPSGSIVPFFQTMAFSRNAEIFKVMGIHAKEGALVNTALVEAYNEIVNFRRKARSEKLPERTRLDTTLAQAFWRNPNLWHIVPDFDQAVMDGEVELTMPSGRLPIYSVNKPVLTYGGQNYRVPAPLAGMDPTTRAIGGYTYHDWGQQIFAELQDTGVRLSLANIELAKKAASFVKLREQYSGLDDDALIDLLMEGIRVPDLAMKQPILLDRKSTIFGYSERHAMDGPNLSKSVTTGATALSLTFRTPPMNTGGIILVTLEVVPEALFERMQDVFLHTANTATLPNFMTDYLDPEKVQVVKNNFVDVEHGMPDQVFGYAPLNHAWKRSLSRIGGKFYRRLPDTWVEDRQRFWSVEQVNPSLTADFYLVNNLPHTVFADTAADPFEVLTSGNVQIVGNTVFGQALEEKGGDYEHILEQVDTTRIKQ